jgi:tRNA A-37 threonylcarbamoyl transferase component Bud32
VSVPDVESAPVLYAEAAILQWLGPDFDRMPDAVIRQDNSLIYKVSTSRYPFPLAIKYCKQSPFDKPDYAGARKMWRALEQCHAKMKQHNNFSVPVPVILLEQVAVVVAEWVDGKSVGDALTDPAFDYKANLENMRYCGTWLHYFHEAFKVPDKLLDTKEKIDSLMSTSLYRDNKKTFRRAIDLLYQSAPAMAAQGFSASRLHGDYKPENVLVSGKRVVGIDIHLEFENVVYYDVAAFLNRLELNFCGPWLWRLSVQRKKFIEAFVDAYGHPGSESQGLEWLRLYSILSLWATHSEKGMSILKKMYLNTAYKRITRRNVHRLSNMRVSR